MNIREQIEQAEVNIEIELPNHRHLESVHFDAHDYDRQGVMEYCWNAKRRDVFSYSFPMKNAHLVKTFKTLKGAKRNFIKGIEGYLKEQEQS